MPLPGREEVSAGGYPGQWAKNPVVMNVATRKFRRAVRLPEAGVAAEAGSGLVQISGIPAVQGADAGQIR